MLQVQYHVTRAVRTKTAAVVVTLDIEKAYDSLQRELIWTTLLEEYGCEEGTVAAL